MRFATSKRALCFVVSVAGPMFAGSAFAQQQPDLPTYETQYYVIHSDLDRDTIREAAVRVDRMADVYYQRTREFSGEIHQKLPFFLFADVQSYIAAGGLPGTAGVFNGKRLMATLGPPNMVGRWETVQHEGFHQFVVAVMRGDIPIWVNEGLASYFEVGEFTGSDFVTGLIPQDRLVRVRSLIQTGKAKSVAGMMNTSHLNWLRGLSGENYDQAWSMVQFLAHADDGKYQGAFNRFLIEINSGKPWREAWERVFGDAAAAFEKRWKEYWLSLPDNPTADLYAQVTVARLTNFLARAAAQRQSFASADAFFAAARDGKLEIADADWLPPSLLNDALEHLDRGRWRLSGRGAKARLVCETPAGTTLEGWFRLSGRRVRSVGVKVRPKSQ